MPWWFGGLLLAALTAGWVFACEASTRQALRRAEAKIDADKLMWDEVLARLDTPAHEYEGYER